MQNQRLGRIQRHTWTDNRAKNAFFYLIFILKQLSKTNKTQFVSDMKKKNLKCKIMQGILTTINVHCKCKQVI